MNNKPLSAAQVTSLVDRLSGTATSLAPDIATAKERLRAELMNKLHTQRATDHMLGRLLSAQSMREAEGIVDGLLYAARQNLAWQQAKMKEQGTMASNAAETAGSKTKDKKASPAKVTSAKASPAKKAEAKGDGAAGRKSKYSGKYIYTKVDHNPRRDGTNGHRSFGLILMYGSKEKGLAYDRYIELGGRNNDLDWDVKKGYARISDK